MARQAKNSETKAESLTVRLQPRTKYGLELMARHHRRSISSLMEWMITETLRRETMPGPTGEQSSVHVVLAQTWDPLEPDRLINLALWDVALLTYDEALRWKIVKEEPTFWDARDVSIERQTEALNRGLVAYARAPNMPRIRDQWDRIKAAANGAKVNFKRTGKEG